MKHATAPRTTANTGRIWNIPNILTAARLFMCVLLFIELHFSKYGWSLLLFSLAAATDWLDGFLARRWNQVTQLGRILDPIADKVLVCGTFVFLAAVPGSYLAPWMAVVVLTREFIVTVIRSFLEQHGKDFSASISGKLKMVLQCATGIAVMFYLWRMAAANIDSARWENALIVLNWSTVLITAYSGIVYLPAAVRLLREIQST
jgi:CDP-diacylglycerol---glycerol-3-phosphate 3-phosphatidyltransferase